MKKYIGAVAIGVLVLVLGFFLLHTHSYGEWVIKKTPTCTLSGIRVRRCFCGKTESEELPSLGHNYGDWVVVRASTCTELGSRERACVCGKKETDVTPSLGHQEVIDPKKDATCTEDGKTQGSHCAICGKVLKSQNTISAQGHNYSGNDCTRCDAKKWWVEFTTTKKYFVVGERIQIDFIFRCSEKKTTGSSGIKLPTIGSSFFEKNQVIASYRVDWKYPDGRVETGTKKMFNNGELIDENQSWYLYWENGIQTLAEITLYIYDDNNYLLGSFTFTVTR